jgi:hypothetical protein
MYVPHFACSERAKCEVHVHVVHVGVGILDNDIDIVYIKGTLVLQSEVSLYVSSLP